MPANNIHIAETKEKSAEECAQFVLGVLKDALSARPVATVAISGGSTPRLLFTELAKSGFDWSQVHIFWVDERCVPPGDDQSNFRLANETWLHPANVPHNNIHRILGELTPDEAAVQYIADVEKVCSLHPGQLPEFDLVHRGMGPDGHTASLFPGEPLIQNETGLAAAVWVEKLNSHRVTMLPGVLKKARNTVLQVAGSDKAEPAREVLTGSFDPMRFPCQIATHNSDRAQWFFDRAAAAKLSRSQGA